MIAPTAPAAARVGDLVAEEDHAALDQHDRPRRVDLGEVLGRAHARHDDERALDLARPRSAQRLRVDGVLVGQQLQLVDQPALQRDGLQFHGVAVRLELVRQVGRRVALRLRAQHALADRDAQRLQDAQRVVVVVGRRRDERGGRLRLRLRLCRVVVRGGRRFRRLGIRGGRAGLRLDQCGVGRFGLVGGLRFLSLDRGRLRLRRRLGRLRRRVLLAAARDGRRRQQQCDREGQQPRQRRTHGAAARGGGRRPEEGQRRQRRNQPRTPPGRGSSYAM